MSDIVFSTEAIESLRRTMLAADPNEAAAVLLAGRSIGANGARLLVREYFPVPSSGYLTQQPLRVSVKPEFLAPLLKRARNENWSIVFAHTHPFGDKRVAFSLADDEGEQILMPSIFGRAPQGPHGAVVFGRSSVAGRTWNDPIGAAKDVDRIVTVGQIVESFGSAGSIDESSVVAEFDRSVRAFGAVGQRVLSKFTVGIVGLGGIGSIVAEQLAHLGVGRIILLDPDVLEETNLNRVVGASRVDIGAAKVEVAAGHLRRIRPTADIVPLVADVLIESGARALLHADMLICCTDSHGSRAVINQLAYQYMIPAIDIGVRIDASDGRVTSIAGRVQMLSPGLPCLVCQNLLDPEEVRRDLLGDEERRRDPYIVGGREPQPAVISLNGTVASMAVTMMLAAVTGFPSSARHQVFLGDKGVVRAINSTKDDNCVVCSSQGALGRGDLWPMPWRPG